ncbi:MAG: B12-binding domain-containing radical SAM protein [Planctomycetes bacterium]|nr:B12-binding domain-containing radical SAM protein [Planctomycetota bacterium]MBL7146193.1 B12-binding domain-containing radical SAM protein [Phycisphaerae bacterium]
MADITLVNLNMLYIRYGEQTERELHVPLGPLYLTRVLEDAGFKVDFRDYQLCDADDPFDMETFLEFLRNPAPVIGLSCMANLLPFTILAMKALRGKYPGRTLVLGGVGSKSVEDEILKRFDWIDIICRGEAEKTGPELLRVLKEGSNLSQVKGISFRDNGSILHNRDRERIQNLDSIAFPAFEKIGLDKYAGFGMMTSRGCPYQCTFCSVAPVWNLESYSRSPQNIVEEMKLLRKRAGIDLFLFQDEFFVSGRKQVMDFCREIQREGLDVEFKAFGRVNLVDREMMRALADSGCIELRFGVESGSDKILSEIKKGFTSSEVLDVVPSAIEIFPRVDAFYVWGFPFETIEDFNQSLFQMISLRMMGARILPSLLCLLPQTDIYREWSGRVPLKFCSYLFPEFVFTGHEVCHGGAIEIPEAHMDYFEMIQQNPDIFPGFFHMDLESNVLSKLKLLRQFGFYPDPSNQPKQSIRDIQNNADSCGAHSPRIEPQNLATRIN